MIHAQKGAKIVLIPPIVTTNAGTFVGHFDAKGFSYATIDIYANTQHTSGGPMTVLKLSECDTTVVTSFAAIAAFTGGTATSASVGFVIPSTFTSGVHVEFQLDLAKRKRYLMLNITVDDTTYVRSIAAVANLTKEKQSCDTTATKHVTNLSNTTITAFGTIVRS